MSGIRSPGHRLVKLDCMAGGQGRLIPVVSLWSVKKILFAFIVIQMRK